MNLKVPVGDEIRELTRVRSLGPSRLLRGFLRDMGSQESIFGQKSEILSSQQLRQWLPCCSLKLGSTAVLLSGSPPSTDVWKAHSPLSSLCFSTISLSSWLFLNWQPGRPSPAPAHLIPHILPSSCSQTPITRDFNP